MAFGLTLREHRIHMKLQYRGEASGSVTYMNNSEAPFGLESLDLEAFRPRAQGRGALDRLMAERKRQGHVLKCYKRMMLVFYHQRPVCA